MSTTKLTFEAVTRQNTGSHFLDSGSLYGYKYNQPIPKRAMTIHADLERNEFHVSISLSHFLKEAFEIDQKLTRWLRKECDKRKEWGYDAYAELLKEKLGYAHSVSDYTYNYENDLDQDFQYSIVSEDEDWLYGDNVYYIIETHNGCDARGGFSDPIVCKPTSSNGNYLELNSGVTFESGIGANGEILTSEELQEMSERYEVGYTHNPTYDFNEAVEKILNTGGGMLTVKLKTGETISASFYANAGEYGTLSTTD